MVPWQIRGPSQLLELHKQLSQVSAAFMASGLVCGLRDVRHDCHAGACGRRTPLAPTMMDLNQTSVYSLLGVTFESSAKSVDFPRQGPAEGVAACEPRVSGRGQRGHAAQRGAVGLERRVAAPVGDRQAPVQRQVLQHLRHWLRHGVQRDVRLGAVPAEACGGDFSRPRACLRMPTATGRCPRRRPARVSRALKTPARP